jgi:glycosyltransferase involved in cell wall biosynthesis
MQALTQQRQGQSPREAQAGGRIAIFFWEGHLSVSPSLLSAAEVLTDAGYTVDFLIKGWGNTARLAGDLPRGTTILDCGFARALSSKTAKRFDPLRIGTLVGAAAYLIFSLWKLRGKRYSAVFGIDSIGGACGQFVASLKRAPFFFWSLELSFDADSRHPRKRLLRNLERRACRKSSWIVVQDRAREKALIAENRPGHTRTLLVPNAPLGEPHIEPSDLLYRRLRIAPELQIVLHAGILDYQVLALEMADSVRSWPPQYCLVLHTNERKPRGDPYIQQIRDLHDERVFLSLDPVGLKEVDSLMSSAYIGLAIYSREIGLNAQLIPFASGKIPSYLRNGVPVIASDQPGVRELLDAYRCGIAISSLDEIPAALESISHNYDNYRAGAIECYLREYEFSTHFDKVIDAIARERAVTWK